MGSHASRSKEIKLAGVERFDEVRDLSVELHRHDHCVVGSQPLVGDDDLSWQRRRALYADRLDLGGASWRLPSKDAVVGCVFACLDEGPNDTFGVAGRFAELYSLRVASHLRGRRGAAAGLGRSVARAAVDPRFEGAVMTASLDALGLYERRGLRLAEVVLYRCGIRKGAGRRCR